MSQKGEVKDGMLIEWDALIPMSDGIALRADVFRPPEDGKYPVLMTMGPYGKGAGLSGRICRSVEEDDRRSSGYRRGFDQQVPELGGPGPGEMGAGGIRGCEGGFPGSGPHARIP